MESILKSSSQKLYTLFILLLPNQSPYFLPFSYLFIRKVYFLSKHRKYTKKQQPKVIYFIYTFVTYSVTLLVTFFSQPFRKKRREILEKIFFILSFLEKKIFLNSSSLPQNLPFLVNIFKKVVAKKVYKIRAFVTLIVGSILFLVIVRFVGFFHIFYKFGQMYFNADFCNSQLILTITQKKSTQKSTLESTKVYLKIISRIKKR